MYSKDWNGKSKIKRTCPRWVIEKRSKKIPMRKKQTQHKILEGESIYWFLSFDFCQSDCRFSFIARFDRIYQLFYLKRVSILSAKLFSSLIYSLRCTHSFDIQALLTRKYIKAGSKNLFKSHSTRHAYTKFFYIVA